MKLREVKKDRYRDPRPEGPDCPHCHIPTRTQPMECPRDRGYHCQHLFFMCPHCERIFEPLDAGAREVSR